MLVWSNKIEVQVFFSYKFRQLALDCTKLNKIQNTNHFFIFQRKIKIFCTYEKEKNWGTNFDVTLKCWIVGPASTHNRRFLAKPRRQLNLYFRKGIRMRSPSPTHQLPLSPPYTEIPHTVQWYCCCDWEKISLRWRWRWRWLSDAFHPFALSLPLATWLILHSLSFLQLHPLHFVICVLINVFWCFVRQSSFANQAAARSDSSRVTVSIYSHSHSLYFYWFNQIIVNLSLSQAYLVLTWISLWSVD